MAQYTVDLPCIADTYVDEQYPDTNYGSATVLKAGFHKSTNIFRSAYLRFDYSSLPARKKIISTALRIYATASFDLPYDEQLTLMRVEIKQSSWEEHTLTYNNEEGQHWYEQISSIFGIGLAAGYYHSLGVPVSKNIAYDAGIGINVVSNNLSDQVLNFQSREGANPPMLRITYEDVPPDAPTPKDPIGAYKDSRGIIRFEWQYNSDVGGVQKKFDLEWSTDQSTWTTVSETTANNYYDMAADTLPAGNIYWRVRCYNEYDEVSPWCDTQTFYAIGAPDAPAINTMPTNSARPVVTWAAFGQQIYQLQVLSGDTVIYDSGEQPSINIRSHKIKAWLADGEYTVRLRIKNEYDLWSDWASTTVTISTAKPAKPTLALRRSEYGIELQIADMADYALIYRSDYGTDDYVCIGKTSSTTYIDNSVRNKAEYQYYVRSVAEMASDVETYEDSDTQFIQAEFRHSLIAPVSDLSNIFAFTRSLDTPPKRVYDRAPGGAYVLYAGRTYPVWEPSEHISTGLSLTFFLRTWAEVESFVALYDRKETVLYRDVKGRKIYGVMSGLQVTEERTGYVVSFLLNQVDYNEEVEV